VSHSADTSLPTAGSIAAKGDVTDFERIVDNALSRRGMLGGGAALGLAAFVTGTGWPIAGARAKGTGLLGFEPVPASTADAVVVPRGYSADVVVSWGDPILPGGVPFDEATRGSAASQARAFGDNNDGMHAFPLGQSRALLTVNNEYINNELFFPPHDGGDQGDIADTVRSAEDVAKAKAAHGVSIVEIFHHDGKWRVDIDGKRNRRITADSPMVLTGPAKGDALLKTAADPTGSVSLGTWNNCGNGVTPWGTYLSCEENFNLYFGTDDKNFKRRPEHKWYGLKAKERRYLWHRHDKRFDLAKEPNEANRAGYIVEIDPMDPTSTPRKHTALGRFKHENAELVLAKDGRIVVYMGDDERGQYLYKFVSAGKYVDGDDRNNRRLLEEGTLYVAKFGPANEKFEGKGAWVALRHGKNGLSEANGFKSQAEVLVFARKAAATVGATTMDRPEWVAANPKAAEAYCALTNNKDRTVKKNALGAAQPLNGPNPRAKNRYGQILRWRAENGDHTATRFTWTLFAMAGNPVNQKGLYKGTPNITADNMFNSQDGLAFDEDGRLWIQTDGNYKNKGGFAGMGNNQMLCSDPATGEIRRFLTGPVACEITGFAWSPDKRTLFIGIQHPGERNRKSHFPGGGHSLPRSSVVAIRKDDGGAIGT
jgi:secreted PhoX family phosphatase